MRGNNSIIQQCHICGRIIHGVGPLVRHVKACKKHLCENCEDRFTCKSTYYTQNCPKMENLLSSVKWS